MSVRLGLGLAALGRPGYVTLNHASDLGGRYDPSIMESHAHAVLDAAFDAGLRYLDAPRSYGRAEDFAASWLRKRAIEPGQLEVASKWGYTYTADWSTSAVQHEIKDHSLAAFKRQLAESVERLGRHLSVYQIHSVTAESKTLEDDALIDAIARLRTRGIRAGLSVSGAGQDVARIRELAGSRGTTIETLALAAALARPWADVVLTGAATVEQIPSNVAARELAYDNELEEQLRSVSIGSAEYWRARSSFTWN